MTKQQRLQIATIVDTIREAAEEAAEDSHRDYLAQFESCAEQLSEILRSDPNPE